MMKSPIRLAFAFLLVASVRHGALEAAPRTISPASSRDRQDERPNTWQARSGNGLVVAGTWTAAIDSVNGAVTGRWTIVDGQGRTAATGGWSAARSPSEWSGVWRAIVYGNNREFAGEWSTITDLGAKATFADLFQKAIATAVRGTWRAGSRSGSWSIRVHLTTPVSSP